MDNNKKESLIDMERSASEQSHSIRLGRRYRANRIEAQYDAIIIGSGPSGLCCASCLSRLGWKVAVLEQHYTAGGFSHVFDRKGYEWDVGLHYVGEMGSRKYLVRRLFDFVTDGRLKWAAQGDVYDRIYVGQEYFDFPKGEKKLKAKLLAEFPNDHEAIRQYFVILRQMRKSITRLSMLKLLPSIFYRIARRIPWVIHPDSFLSTKTVLDRLTDNTRLKAILAAQWGNYGLTPDASSFLIHSVVANHYLGGGFYPVGGSRQIAAQQIPGIRQAGGEVFTYAQVKQIDIEDNRAIGVTMEDGKQIRAPVVISAAGVANTVANMLPADVVRHFGWSEQLKKVRSSGSYICLYIGLNQSDQQLQLPTHNIWVYANEKYQQNLDHYSADQNSEFPLVYISFPSAKDPQWQERYPGKSTIEVIAPDLFSRYQQWHGTRWGQRGEDYEQLKQRLALRLLEQVYQKLPHIKEAVDYWELSTPLSVEYFSQAPTGELYGLEASAERFKQSWLRPKTPIKGFYLSGQDILTCGIAGAGVSGMLTAMSVLGFSGTGKLTRRMKQALISQAFDT